MLRKPVVSALLIGFALAACSEASNPVAPEPQAGLLGGLLTTTLTVVERVVPARSETVVTATVGAEGGTLSGGGATLSIPAGALSGPVEITMRVPTGRFYEVQFAPHGLQFAAPATLSFDVGLLTGLLNGQLRGAYFDGDLDGRYRTLETFSTQLLGSNVSFQISHFSGYCVVSGRSQR